MLCDNKSYSVHWDPFNKEFMSSQFKYFKHSFPVILNQTVKLIRQFVHVNISQLSWQFKISNLIWRLYLMWEQPAFSKLFDLEAHKTFVKWAPEYMMDEPSKPYWNLGTVMKTATRSLWNIYGHAIGPNFCVRWCPFFTGSVEQIGI